MEMQGERRIPAPRQAVWEKLNDPEVLRTLPDLAMRILGAKTPAQPATTKA